MITGRLMEDGRLIGGHLMEAQLYTEWDDNHAVSIKHGLRTADHGLRTGYKIRTRYKTRTGKYGLGIKHGLGIKRGLQTADWV